MRHALSRDRIGGLLIFILSGGYLLLSFDIEVTEIVAASAITPRSMPQMLGLLGVLCGLALLVKPRDLTVLDVRGLRWRELLSFVLLMIAYASTLRPLGFLIASSLFLCLGARLLGAPSWWRNLVLAIGLSTGFWALMSLVLDVYIAPWPQILT